ncbi:MAG: endonuclease [Bacteroidetes bacterium]|nr:endonuclease [Bacteroidota bacterium]
MKKIVLTSIATFCITILSFAQATLPAIWGFPTTTLPTGFSSVGTFAYYSGSGNPAPAAKFGATGTILTVAFVGTPGTISYDLVGNPPPSSTWAGTFRVEESVNGTVWTTVGTDYTTLPTTYTTYTHALLSASRFVRFNFVTHSVGNVGLDNVNITVGVSTVQQINVQQSATTIVNGGTYTLSSPVSTLLPTTFAVQNTGTVGTLNISGVTITGPAAADYTVSSFPATVAPTASGNMVINFTPSVAGTRIAAINIASNDPTNPTYIVNLYGVGGTLATEPTTQATSMIFSTIKSFHFNVAFTAASGSPDGYIVLRRTGSPITDIPVDGTVYQRGDVIGNSKVFYSSTATAFYPNDIYANTTYYFAVFTYNGPGTFRNYNTTTPLMGNQTSAGSMQPATYYNTVNTSSATFVTDLHNKINPHTIEYYSNYGPKMVSKFFARDTTGDQRVITCVYSGENKVYTEPFDWTTSNFSREHTYCHSWMPTVNNSPDNTAFPEYNDYHMLTPTNQIQVNGIRSNYPLGEVVGTPISSYLGSKLGYDAAGHKVFEPRDSDKGDAARCMMYEATCYTGVAYSGAPNTNCVYGGSWALPSYISSTIPYGQDQDVLKRWNYLDPPSNVEIARNDYVDSIQGNRNPFIDSMQYACYIDFSTMTKIAGTPAPCNTASVADHDMNNDIIILAPNPNNGNFTAYYSSSQEQKVTVRLFDVMGRVVYSDIIKVNIGNNPMEMQLQDLNKGIYLFEFTTQHGKQNVKLMID